MERVLCLNFASDPSGCPTLLKRHTQKAAKNGRGPESSPDGLLMRPQSMENREWQGKWVSHSLTLSPPFPHPFQWSDMVRSCLLASSSFSWQFDAIWCNLAHFERLMLRQLNAVSSSQKAKSFGGSMQRSRIASTQPGTPPWTVTLVLLVRWRWGSVWLWGLTMCYRAVTGISWTIKAGLKGHRRWQWCSDVSSPPLGRAAKAKWTGHTSRKLDRWVLPCGNEHVSMYQLTCPR